MSYFNLLVIGIGINQATLTMEPEATAFYASSQAIQKLRSELKNLTKEEIFKDPQWLLYTTINRRIAKHNTLEFLEDTEACEVLRLILAHGGNPNIRISVFSTWPNFPALLVLLMHHYNGDKTEAIKILLFYGADITAKDCERVGAVRIFDYIKDHAHNFAQYPTILKLLTVIPTDPETFEECKKSDTRDFLYPDDSYYAPYGAMKYRFNPVKKYPQEFTKEFEWYANWQKEQLVEKHGSITNYLNKRELGQK